MSGTFLIQLHDGSKWKLASKKDAHEIKNLAVFFMEPYIEPKLTREEAIKWMMESPDNWLETDEYTNQKLYYRWANDQFESSNGGEWRCAAFYLSFLSPRGSTGFREFRKKNG